MRLLAALCLLLLATELSFAENTATSLKLRNGTFVVAQSYCGMCADKATACRIACNGSGTCIQACDNDYRDCADQNLSAALNDCSPTIRLLTKDRPKGRSYVFGDLTCFRRSGMKPCSSADRPGSRRRRNPTSSSPKWRLRERPKR